MHTVCTAVCAVNTDICYCMLSTYVYDVSFMHRVCRKVLFLHTPYMLYMYMYNIILNTYSTYI